MFRTFGVVTSPTVRRRRNHLRRLFVEQLEDRRLMAVIDLATLTAAQGTTIFGADADDRSGRSVSNAGDVNGDGFDDMIIGAYVGDAAGNTKQLAGDSYVIFGSASLPTTIDLATLGAVGITIFGADAFDRSGFSVSGAGDVNGDGFDDLLIGANQADASGNTKTDAGESYVIFGGASLPATIDLATLGAAGITIFGADALDYSGRSVSNAGDVNGDGFADLLIGARLGDASGNAKSAAGDSYVIFGAAYLPATIDLATLGAAGITIFGEDPGDFSGISVSSAGDVNGDGFDDLLVGAALGNGSGNANFNAGDSYVIFGGPSLPATIDLATLGAAGITIFGADTLDRSGTSVSSVGDVNGDGFDDLLIGAYNADASGNAKSYAGDSYVIFGGASLPATIDLATLGAAGITIFGADAFDRSGFSVSSAGDVNGDGFDDLFIGAYRADASGEAKSSAGDSYVMFGGASLPTTIDLATLGAAGITIFGEDPGDYSGRLVSSAGDVNGDGFDDLLIGASLADSLANGKLNAGDSYVIFGGNGFTSSVTHLGTAAAETLTGTVGADVMVGDRGNDTLLGSGGADVLIGGQGNDVLAIGDFNFKRIVGGTGSDTLRLDVSGLALDLTTLPDNRLLGIETIDITGSGNNTLTLTQREVLNISDESNALIVRRNAGDVVNFGAGWTQGVNKTIGASTFNYYVQGAAKLFVESVSADTTPPAVTDIIASGSAWSAAFIDAVDGGGTGAGNGLGYALTSGLTLPNAGINRLFVQFNEPVVGFNAANFALLGVNVANYSTTPGFLTVTYDSANMRGVIQFTSSITKDKLRIGVSDAVTDVAFNSLDGDSNALPGGVLNFRFNILVGDANNDGSVNGGDLSLFAASFNKSAGNPGYDPRPDWNSDGSVNGGDLSLFAGNFNQSLPGAEPGPLNFPPPLRPAADEEESSVPFIDAFFSQLDEEDELLLME